MGKGPPWGGAESQEWFKQAGRVGQGRCIAMGQLVHGGKVGSRFEKVRGEFVMGFVVVS
jgi:hypothetical protein